MELEMQVVVLGDAGPRATTRGFLWQTLVPMLYHLVRLGQEQRRRIDCLSWRPVLDRDVGYLARESRVSSDPLFHICQLALCAVRNSQLTH
jgi:hypothetical protein